MAIEIESKLVIRHGCYETVEGGLRNWSPNENFMILYGDDISYNDFYYDTQNKTLYRNGLYLRIRHPVGLASKEITYRGYNAIGAKLLQMTDYSGPLTKESIKTILNRLKNIIQITDYPNNESNLISCLEKNGVKQIFSFDLQRMNFLLEYRKQKIGVVLLDRLIYHIDDLSIPYQEIEIKVQDTSLPVADHLMVLLLNEFPNALQPTTLTKLQRAFLNKDTMTN